MFISLQTRKSRYLRNLELGALLVAILKKISSKYIFMACKIFANCIDFTIQKAHDGIFEF